MHGHELKIVFTFAATGTDDNALMAVVLKILTNPIITTFLYRTSCFS